jgi:oligopeptidase B
MEQRMTLDRLRRNRQAFIRTRNPEKYCALTVRCQCGAGRGCGWLTFGVRTARVASEHISFGGIHTVRKAFSRLQILALAVLLQASVMAQTPAISPPVAKKVPKTFALHGDTRTDDYFWLRDDKRKDPEVIAYLEAENAYTKSMLQSHEGLEQSLYKEILGRIKETDLSVSYKLGEYFYYSRTEQGKQYSYQCRKKGSLDGAEEILLDLNKLAEGNSFLALGGFDVSDDGNLLAYTTDTNGYRQYKLHVKDLRTGKTLDDTADRITSLSWASDNRTLLFTTEDPVTKRSNQLHRLKLGGKAETLYEEKDELYNLFSYRTRDRKYIFAVSASSTTTETRFLPCDHPNGEFKVVLPRQIDHEYYVDHYKDEFYIRTNDGAKNFRVVSAPISDPQKKNWKDFIPGNAAVKVEDMDFFANHCVVSSRENGLQRFTVIDMRTGKKRSVNFPEETYAVSGAANPEFDTKKFRFGYQSLVTPSSVYEYDLDSHEQTLLKQNEVVGGYDKSAYETKRIFATASDGVKVPVSIVHKKGIKLDGSNPTLLYGYGSYGVSIPDSFSAARLSLLNRGVVYAIAHIRGGGELGEEWHDNGKLMKKINTFTDFIASAEHLISQKYTSRDRLAIQGGSAGGLLMGAVTNMRPDLFKVVLSQVPFVDVMNTMLDASLPLTVGEYLEWGNPNEKAAYDYMRSYSPYDNIGAKEYPIMLVMTSLNDSQVGYWEPAKYVAKLRATKTDRNLLLLKTNMGAGHGGASGRYDALKETAFAYTFILTQLGVEK